MDHDTTPDRRHPRIGVHDLRRDLRDADHDRYRLVAELEQHRRSRTTSNRLLGAMIIIAGGFTSGLWFTLPSREQAVAQRPVEVPPVANHDAAPAAVAAATAGSPDVVPVAAVPAAAEEPAVQDRKLAQSAPSLASSPSRRPRRPTGLPAASGRRQSGAERRSESRAADLRRARPRPLSPGEFGRQASL